MDRALSAVAFLTSLISELIACRLLRCCGDERLRVRSMIARQSPSTEADWSTEYLEESSR